MSSDDRVVVRQFVVADQAPVIDMYRAGVMAAECPSNAVYLADYLRQRLTGDMADIYATYVAAQDSGPRMFLVAVIGGAVAGCVGGAPAPAPRALELVRMSVAAAAGQVRASARARCVW